MVHQQQQHQQQQVQSSRMWEHEWSLKDFEIQDRPLGKG
jgi:hypothetical protein